MAYSPAELKILFQATLSEYLNAARVAGVGFRRNWWMPIVHAVGVWLFVVVATLIIGLMGPLVGGFLLGVVAAYLLAGYLGTVESAVDKEPLALKEILPKANSLFTFVINSLFILFLLFFVANHLLPPATQGLVVSFLSLIVVTVFNSLPESVYLDRRSGTDAFAASFEFIRENVFEWLFPLAVLMTIVIGLEGGGRGEFLLFFTAGDPFQSVVRLGIVIASVVNSLFAFPLIGGGVPQFLVGLIQQYVLFSVVFLVFIFRGALYRRLSTSGRRKRIYQYRAGV